MAEYIDKSNGWGYTEYSALNRFQNLDGIETKIVEHLINSTTKHAEIFWKILKYDDLYALTKPALTKKEKLELVNNDNGESTSKKVFITPRDADGQVDQSSSVYIYVEEIKAINGQVSLIGVTVDTSVYTKIGVIAGDGDKDSNEKPEWVNPNESNEQGSIVVPIKSRETVLVKCILAELNGLYLDGVGYLLFENFKEADVGQKIGYVDMPHNHKENSHGHRICFGMRLSGVSTDSQNSL
jgi:hypothetical protein